MKRVLQENYAVASDGNTQECLNDVLACNPFKRGDEFCYDSHSRCFQWAEDGECGKNPSYMMVNCRLACGQCTAGADECVDHDRNCKLWASEGECEVNPGYMLVNCALSCEQCSTTDSTDNDVASLSAENIDSILGLEFGILQTIEGSEETRAKVQTVMREAGRFMEHYLAALKQKGISDIDALMQCYNTHRLCALWAAEGECTSNSEYMNKNCGPVCKSCELSSNPTVSIN